MLTNKNAVVLVIIVIIVVVVVFGINVIMLLWLSLSLSLLSNYNLRSFIIYLFIGLLMYVYYLNMKNTNMQTLRFQGFHGGKIS